MQLPTTTSAHPGVLPALMDSRRSSARFPFKPSCAEPDAGSACKRVLVWQVVGPDRPGRRLAVVGECASSAGLVRWARDCDVIVHAAASRVCPSVAFYFPIHLKGCLFGFLAVVASHTIRYQYNRLTIVVTRGIPSGFPPWRC